MKTLQFLCTAMMLVALAPSLNAQTMNCDWFTVTGLEPDTFNANNTLINIQMIGGISDFASYPHVASVLNCIGDTVATGGLWFFGQMGGTTQGYPVSLIDEDVCLPLTIEFIYGNDSFETDTCIFTFGGSELCDLFSVQGISNNPLNSSESLISIELDGSFNDFANYPFISSITDCNSDTVSTGSIFFFGQAGGTTQDYPTSLIPSDACFPLTITFVYGNAAFENDTCFFLVENNPLGVEREPFLDLKIFPNPTGGIVQLTADLSISGKEYQLFDLAGTVIQSGRIQSTRSQLDLSTVARGIYIFRIEDQSLRVIKE
jgi:hypothetical protein